MPLPRGNVRTPQYLHTQGTQRDRWMVSYVDTMTILLILFIAVAAKGVDDTQHTSAVAPAQRGQSSPEKPVPPFDPVKQQLERLGVSAHIESRGLVITLPQEILFASGEDRLDNDALATVHEIADAIRDLPNKVRLVGHADSRPIRNSRFRDNWDLSAARSLRLLETLNRQCGIPESRMSIESLGSYDPRVSDETAEGRASNRRVEIVLLNPD